MQTTQSAWRGLRVGGLVLLSSAMLVACGSDDETTTPPPSPSNLTNVTVKATSEIKAADAIDTSGDDEDFFTILTTPAVAKTSSARRGIAAAGDAPPLPDNTLRVHYYREDEAYNNWGLHLWGDTTASVSWESPLPKTGVDAFGAYYDVPMSGSSAAARTVNFIIHAGNQKDLGEVNESYVVPAGKVSAEIWRNAGEATIYTSNPNVITNDFETVRIHYKRFSADYANWGMQLSSHVDLSKIDASYKNAEGTEISATTPVPFVAPVGGLATGKDDFGVWIDVPVRKPSLGGRKLTAKILKPGTTPVVDANNRVVSFAAGGEVWLVEGDSSVYYTVPTTTMVNANQARAYWATEKYILWPRVESAGTFKLLFSNNGDMTVGTDGALLGTKTGEITLKRVEASVLPAAVAQKYKYISTPYQVLEVQNIDTANVKNALRTQLLAARTDANGKILDATSLQTAGVLDDLYAANATKATLGVTIAGGSTNISVWAPTAVQAALAIYDRPVGGDPSRLVPLNLDTATGIWSASLSGDLSGKYYKFIVDVHVRGIGLIRNKVTDPYSISLSTSSKRSYIADLNAANLKPAGWDTHTAPALAAQEDMVIYELHVRDFSINDGTVPAANRGKYLAFTNGDSNGMKHLKALAAAGLTDIHLLPIYDIGTVPESDCLQPPIAGSTGDSPVARTVINTLKDKDCFNWGYDPLHYTAPEGSYSSNPADGAVRIKEARQMIMALHGAGLRVGMDVVYNHTLDAGQSRLSVLDRVVPGYYHRLNGVGEVEKSTCCFNTATENAMMGKLMIDSAKTWAVAYKLDSFRFDLMGHQPRSVMEQLRDTVNAAAGRTVQLIGEGWNFGEVASGARFEQASQLSLNGSGIGTFSDRARDRIRGGGCCDDGDVFKLQGYVSGLAYDSNGFDGRGTDTLLEHADMVRLGLAGSLRSYEFTVSDGSKKTGEQIDYGGSPAGYTTDPQEVVNYVENHDNRTLYDALVAKMPASATTEDRVRAQILALALNTFSQGVAYFHAGGDILRSKSMDNNSFNSGDWFNRLDWSYTTNNFGVGLPVEGSQDLAKQFMNSSVLSWYVPTSTDITKASNMFRDLLAVRKSSTLFRMRTADDVKTRLKFYNTGTGQIPTLIVEHLDGTNYPGANYSDVMVLVNVDKVAHSYTIDAEKGKAYVKHEALKTDERVANDASYNAADGTFAVPPRTAVVWVVK